MATWQDIKTELGNISIELDSTSDSISELKDKNDNIGDNLTKDRHQISIITTKVDELEGGVDAISADNIQIGVSVDELKEGTDQVNNDVKKVIEIIPTGPEVDIVIDNVVRDFEIIKGVWSLSGAVDFYGENKSMYSVYANGEARWNFRIPLSGLYKVYAWYTNKRAIPNNGNWFYSRDSYANYFIPTRHGEQEVIVNQNVDAGGWSLLGTFEMGVGNLFIRILHDDQNPDKPTIADAIRVVRIGDLPGGSSSSSSSEESSSSAESSSSSQSSSTESSSSSEESLTDKVVVDTNSVDFQVLGEWQESTAIDYYGNAPGIYLIGGFSPDGWATWNLNLKNEGFYDVFVWCTAQKDASINIWETWSNQYVLDSIANYHIMTKDGIKEVIFNQNANIGNWSFLGRYEFNAGAANKVTVSVDREDIGRRTVADAIMYVKVEDVSEPVYKNTFKLACWNIHGVGRYVANPGPIANGCDPDKSAYVPDGEFALEAYSGWVSEGRPDLYGKAALMMDWINEYKPDVFCLQEAGSRWLIDHAMDKSHLKYGVYSDRQSPEPWWGDRLSQTSNGWRSGYPLIILSKWPLTQKFEVNGADGRSIIGAYIDELDLWVLTMHAHPTKQFDAFTSYGTVFEQYKDERTIICGDFNMGFAETPDARLTKVMPDGSIYKAPPEPNPFLKLFECGYRNLTRFLAGIDHIGGSSRILDLKVDAKKHWPQMLGGEDVIISDHSCIEVTLELAL